MWFLWDPDSPAVLGHISMPHPLLTPPLLAGSQAHGNSLSNVTLPPRQLLVAKVVPAPSCRGRYMHSPDMSALFFWGFPHSILLLFLRLCVSGGVFCLHLRWKIFSCPRPWFRRSTALPSSPPRNFLLVSDWEKAQYEMRNQNASCHKYISLDMLDAGAGMLPIPVTLLLRTIFLRKDPVRMQMLPGGVAH